jgi:hypothetical protein
MAIGNNGDGSGNANDVVMVEVHKFMNIVW